MPRRKSAERKLQSSRDSRTLSFFTCKVRLSRVCHVPAVKERRSECFSDSPQQQGLLSSLIAKVINNLQVTVKNIHIRYEDKLSVPGVRVSLFALIARLLTIFSSIRLQLESRWPASLLCR